MSSAHGVETVRTMASPVNGFANNVIDNITMADDVTAMWEMEWEWQGVTYRGQCEFGHSDDERCTAQTLNRERCVRPPGHHPPHVAGKRHTGILLVQVEPIE